MQAKYLCRALDNESYKVFFFEQPFFIPGAVGNASQDITKLTMLAGTIHGWLSAKGNRVFPVEVNDWKGQTPKEIMHPRIKARIPDYDGWRAGGHDVDAVGIGLWVLGSLG